MERYRSSRLPRSSGSTKKIRCRLFRLVSIVVATAVSDLAVHIGGLLDHNIDDRKIVKVGRLNDLRRYLALVDLSTLFQINLQHVKEVIVPETLLDLLFVIDGDIGYDRSASRFAASGSLMSAICRFLNTSTAYPSFVWCVRPPDAFCIPAIVRGLRGKINEIRTGFLP